MMYFHRSFRLATVHGLREALEVVLLAIERLVVVVRRERGGASEVAGVVLKMGSGRSTVVVRLGPQPTRAGRAKPTTMASKGLYFTKNSPSIIRLATDSFGRVVLRCWATYIPVLGYGNYRTFGCGCAIKNNISGSVGRAGFSINQRLSLG